MAIDGQSERVILRRMYAFLKSRKLDATAYTLEHEARLKLDLCHAVKVISKGRWRKADKYLSSFFGAKGGTASSSAALYVVRFQRMVGALKQQGQGSGSHAWAVRYYRRKVTPLIDNLSLTDSVAALADCVTALFHSDLATLRRKYPDDDDEYRSQRAIEFLGHYRQSYQQGDDLFLCTQDTMDDNLVRVWRAAALGLRRYARPRERLSARFIAELYLLKRKCIRSGGYAPFLSF
uniref:Uncharacterized protein n=1 Tax=Avena sativa TaxID=4498 RepID=A0ACD6ADP0_AVESA